MVDDELLFLADVDDVDVLVGDWILVQSADEESDFLVSCVAFYRLKQ